jgi:UDP-3-O-[3-hydroxymyristoyl] glucosamine N-acyltransferase
MKLRDLADKLGCELVGDGGLEINGVAGLEQAGPAEITFLANPKYGMKVKESRAAAIIAANAERSGDKATLVSRNPYLDFARALELFYQPPALPTLIHPTASIAPTAVVGAGASIGAFVSVGDHVVIGERCVLHPHVVVYAHAKIGDDFLAHSHAVVREHCEIGHRVILQNHVVIGGDGYGFAKRADGSHHKIVQSGITVLEDDVEVQTLTSIDRATVGQTRVRRGAKIDSLVQVGHACEVGEDNIICAQTGLAGSTILKKSVLLAGQVGVSGHLTINDNCVVYAQSGVGHDVPAGTVISGSPAFDFRDWRRAVTAFPKFPEMIRKMRELEDRLSRLEKEEEQAK